MFTSCRPRRGLAAVRYAVTRAAGWDWCPLHGRSRWDGPDSCRKQHPTVPEDRLAACGTCDRRHGPTGWGAGCEPMELAA